MPLKRDREKGETLIISAILFYNGCSSWIEKGIALERCDLGRKEPNRKREGIFSSHKTHISLGNKG